MCCCCCCPPLVLHSFIFLPTPLSPLRFSILPRLPSLSSPPSTKWFHARLQKTHLAAAFSVHRHCCCMDSGPQLQSSSNEDMDAEVEEEELDALFDELGEVVLADPEPRRPEAEANEDSDCLSFALALARAAYEVKAAEIKVLHVRPLIYWARFFVIATAFSRPQIDAIRKRMRDRALEDFNKTLIGGDTKPNSWTLLDFGDVVVHIFYPKERAFYNLDEFYGNATLIDLPFTRQLVL